MLTIKDFEAARERLRPVLEQTRLIYSPWFSKNVETRSISSPRIYRRQDLLRFAALTIKLPSSMMRRRPKDWSHLRLATMPRAWHMQPKKAA